VSEAFRWNRIEIVQRWSPRQRENTRTRNTTCISYLPKPSFRTVDDGVAGIVKEDRLGLMPSVSKRSVLSRIDRRIDYSFKFRGRPSKTVSRVTVSPATRTTMFLFMGASILEPLVRRMLNRRC